MTDRTVLNGVPAAPVRDVPEVEPGDVGLDARRLARVGEHLAGYVDDGRLPGWSVLVSRGGRVAYAARYGMRDVEAGLPVEGDTIWRIFSMTKPIVSVAALMLFEEGRFELTDPVARYLPAFAEPRVFTGGTPIRPATRPAATPVTVRHLLTHTSGLTYGFHRVDPVDGIYRHAGYDFGVPRGVDLEAATAAWAGFPLVCEPGSAWNYSVSTDVLGRLVEVVSGQPLDAFLGERILGPLGMADTGFGVPPEKLHRLAAMYSPGPGGRVARNDAFGRLGHNPRPRFLSGGGGLVSTAGDYHRFTRFLAAGGELDGVRLLGPRTVSLMTSNHLPGGVDLAAFGRRVFAETRYTGFGFGLGVAVVVDPVATGTLTSPGEFGWGGLASTAFWVAPAEELAVVLMTQLTPSDTYPLRSQLRQLVYAAILD